MCFTGSRMPNSNWPYTPHPSSSWPAPPFSRPYRPHRQSYQSPIPLASQKELTGKSNRDIDIHIKINPFAVLAVISILLAAFGLRYGLDINRATPMLSPKAAVIPQQNPLIPSSNPTSSKPGPAATAKSAGPAPTDAPATLSLPKLYASLVWETQEQKVLTFTSGKKSVEINGVHMESSQLKDYPMNFIYYYESNLQTLGFKQTLNSKSANGNTETFQKNNKYFTFGVNYIFQGSGDTKKLVGYKAFIEHN